MKIWMYWHDNDINKTAPYLNQRCIQKWKELNQQSYEFRLLDKESACAQEPLFKDIVENCKHKRSHSAQSDLLRLILLEKHGGIWVDSSVYPMKPLRDFFDTMTGHSDFFSYRFFPRSLSNTMGDRELVSWFLVATVSRHSTWCC